MKSYGSYISYNRFLQYQYFCETFSLNQIKGDGDDRFAVMRAQGRQTIYHDLLSAVCYLLSAI
jgi:hypothetical protein